MIETSNSKDKVESQKLLTVHQQDLAEAENEVEVEKDEEVEVHKVCQFQYYNDISFLFLDR